MIRGLYGSASGMDVQQARAESVSNNMSNATTPGYKKENLLSKSFPEYLLIEQGGPEKKGPFPWFGPAREVGHSGAGTMVTGILKDFAQGAVQDTGNPADIMLSGPGFLAVSLTSPGMAAKVGYTRNGMLKVDREGYLITGGGYRVLGQTGEIRVGDEGFTVKPDGTVEVKGSAVDRLRLVEFDDPAALQKDGEGGVFTSAGGDGRAAVTTSVQQGFLERSNVNVIDEMVNLVTVLRIYEANQRLVQAHDEILGKAVNQVGSLR